MSMMVNSTKEMLAALASGEREFKWKLGGGLMALDRECIGVANTLNVLGLSDGREQIGPDSESPTIRILMSSEQQSRLIELLIKV